LAQKTNQQTIIKIYMKKLSVNIVIYNGAKFVPYLMASLKRQTFKDFEIIYVDNCSTDGTLELMEKELKDSGIEYKIIKSDANYGFAAGHNTAYRETTAPFFLLQNVDMYLMPDVLEKAVKFLEDYKDAVSVAPRLMRWDFEKVFNTYKNGSDLVSSAKEGFTSQVDAIGIRLFKNRRAVEWLTREVWAKDSENEFVRDLYDKQVCEVFGVSGALPVYRKSATEKVLLPGNNLFDPTYHSYKEDLDLAYRLRNAGYTSYVLLDTVAYHDRTGAGPKEMGDWAALKNKKKQSAFVKFHSYKNHLRTLYKNEYWQNFFLDLPFIFWYEFKKFFYLLLTDPKIIFKGWWEIIKERKYTRGARKTIISSRRLYWRGIRRWFL